MGQALTPACPILFYEAFSIRDPLESTLDCRWDSFPGAGSAVGC